MKVLSIEICNFRNIKSQVVSFGPGVNLIKGSNGQGKTNLVEAVSFLSWLKSFRTSRTADLIRAGQGVNCECAVVAAVVTGVDGQHEIRAEIGRGYRKVIIDGSPAASARETMEILSVTCLSPDDPGVLEGGPDGRRILIDRFAAMIDPQRTAMFSGYARLLKERNVLLRGGAGDTDLLDAVEENLSEYGAEYVAVRLDALDRVVMRLPGTLAEMTGADLFVTAGYSSRWLPSELAAVSSRRSGAFRKDAAGLLRAALAAKRASDTAIGYTTVGPHADDIEVGLEGLKARGHASRGQKKVLMLAWKAAEAAEIAALRGEEPVLVLDDALADLDPGRQAGVVEFLTRYAGQSFITSAVTDPVVFCGADVIDALCGVFTPACLPICGDVTVTG